MTPGSAEIMMIIINMFGLLTAFHMKLFSLLKLSFFVFILVLKKPYDSIYKSNKGVNHPRTNMLSV